MEDNAYHPTDLSAVLLVDEVEDFGSDSEKERIGIDEILTVYTGEFGKWQKIHFVLASLAWAFEALHTMVMIFADQEPWTSTPNTCDVEPSFWNWSQGTASSTVSEFSLVCGDKYKVGLVQSMFFAGCMIGTYLVSNIIYLLSAPIPRPESMHSSFRVGNLWASIGLVRRKKRLPHGRLLFEFCVWDSHVVIATLLGLLFVPFPHRKQHWRRRCMCFCSCNGIRRTKQAWPSWNVHVLFFLHRFHCRRRNGLSVSIFMALTLRRVIHPFSSLPTLHPSFRIRVPTLVSGAREVEGNDGHHECNCAYKRETRYSGTCRPPNRQR